MNAGEISFVASRVSRMMNDNLIRDYETAPSSLVPHVSAARDGFLASISRVRVAPYNNDLEFLGHLRHSDVFANILARVASSLREYGNTKLSEDVACLNKLLNGIDFFVHLGLPEVFLLVHPSATVIGRSKMPNFSVIYQKVTVGSAGPDETSRNYPEFSGPVVLFSGVTVIGNCLVGKNVVFAANAMVVGGQVPDNSIVVGQHPKHRFLSGAEEVISTYFTLPA